MDFSKVTNITIPQGNVTKITDASGKVLWQKYVSGNDFFIFETTDGSTDLGSIEIGGSDSYCQTVQFLKEAYEAGHQYVYYIAGSSIRDLYIRVTNLTAKQALELRRDDFTCYFEGITYTCNRLAVNDTVQADGQTISIAKGTGSIQLELTFSDVFDGGGDDAEEMTEDLNPKISYNSKTFINFGNYPFLKYSYSSTRGDWQIP